MGILSVKDLRTDMVLAEDLKDGNGRLLIRQGAVLTEQDLKICKIWGIVEADIAGVSSEEVEASAWKAYDAAAVAATAEAVRRRFCCNDMAHPAIRELVRLCTLRTAEGKGDVPVDAPTSAGLAEDCGASPKPPPLDLRPADFIDKNTHLSTLPAIYRQIIEAISKPSSSVYDIENVINKDTNLAARLLALVNSAFFNYPSRIDTVSRAVNIIGTKQLSTLAIGVNIISMFKNIPPGLVNMKLFWEHSVLCGVCAGILAGYKHLPNTERMFLAGLLHDIGRLMFYNRFPAESARTIVTARRNCTLLYLEERDTFGMDHSAVGRELLKNWKMPLSLEEMVHYHHEPQKAADRMEASILHLADLMANAMAAGTSGERLVPPLSPEAWTQIDLSPNVLSLTMELADRQLDEVFEMLYGEKGASNKSATG
ncbi:MAG: HDOD domain-containing protein [Deltaproteobacteria bacterium]|nr:HDOD domain-containing protein [Deltaproteobacteria bacterium]